MPNRRMFVKSIAGAAAGMYALGGNRSNTALAQRPLVPGTSLKGDSNRLYPDPSAPRRHIVIAGQPVRVVDVHTHAGIDVGDVVKGTPLADRAGSPTLLEDRVALMDQMGIDVAALTINSYWWWRTDDRGLAREICQAQNEGLAQWVAKHPDRLVAMCSVPLQFPDLAAEILEEGVKRGTKGVTMTANVNGEDPSMRKFDVFWAKVAELDQFVFMHPQGAGHLMREGALSGAGDLGNVIGMPISSTVFLSRLIFEGVFDRHPNLRVCAAHAGGYLPSYFGRTQAACDSRANPGCLNTKEPREYLRSQIFADTMAFSDEGVRHLVAEMGASQVMYGTDNPYNWPAGIDVVVGNAFLSDNDKRAILGGNAARLLKLSPET